MSSVYVLEPRTSGRVVLHTSHGPVSVSLWCAESQLGTRSFLTHASAGYYDDLPFHRVVPGLLVQTGDPTRTGDGGVSAVGGNPEKGIPRETHGRLKFRRRGIVALVSDKNGFCRSQFFITLARADWLDGMHTIIGHVEGDTIFNVLNMANNGEIDGFDVPDTPKLLSIEVQECPFENLIPPTPSNESVRSGSVTRNTASGNATRPDRIAKRPVVDKAVLSFTEDDDEDGEDGFESCITEKEGNESLGINSGNSEALCQRRSHFPAKSLEVRKRARTGIVSCHEVLVGHPSSRYATAVRNVDKISKEAFRPIIIDQPKVLQNISRTVGNSTRSNAEILADAEREFQELKAESKKRHASAKASVDVHIDSPSAERALDLMPSKYANLQRGVKPGNRLEIGRRKNLDSAAARLRELKRRVRAGKDSGLAQRLVFRKSAGQDGERDDEYSTIDPLDGSRGYGVRKHGLSGGDSVRSTHAGTFPVRGRNELSRPLGDP